MNSKECDKPGSGGGLRVALGLIALAFAPSVCLAGPRPSTTPPVQPTVRLWPTAVVVQDQVQVGDLCELSNFNAETHERLRDLVVVPSPPQGGSTVITLRELREVLTAADINMARTIVKGAVECGVTRPRVLSAAPVETAAAAAASDGASEVVEPQTLRDAVVVYFEDELSRYGGRVQVDFGPRAGGVLDLAGPQYSFAVRRRSGRPLGLIDVLVEVRREGRLLQKVELQPIVHFFRDVVVARRAINQHAEIRPESVHLVEIEFDRLERLGLGDLSQVIGQRAKRFLPAGTALQGQDVEMVPLVKRGQLVDVFSSVGGVSIMTSAKAMETGSLGDLVELRSSERKGRILTGLITGPRRVELRLGGAPAEDRGSPQLAEMGGRR